MNELSEGEIKATVLYKLVRRGCWGERYFPLDTLVNWLGKKIKNDGKAVREAVASLEREGYLLPHKKGDTISLNPKATQEIITFVKKYLGLWL
jgi:hypothetical protein